MRFALCVLGALAAGSALAAPGPWDALPEDPAAARGVVRAERLPALEARVARSLARTEAVHGLREGRLSLAEALPELAGADLLDPAVIVARRGALDRAGVARATERRVAVPPLDDARLTARGLAAHTRALDAEDAADAEVRRVLLAVDALHAAAPGITRAALRASRAPLDAAWQAAAPSLTAAGGPTPAQAADAAALEAARAAWEALEDAVVEGWLRGDVDAAVAPIVEADLARLAAGVGGVAGAAADARLAALRPLLPARASAILEAEASWMARAARAERLEALAAAEARLAAVASEPLPDDPLVLDEAVAASSAVVARAQAAFDALPEVEPSDPRYPRKALAYVDLQIAETHAERAVALRQRFDAAQDAASVAAAAARQAADEAAARAAGHPAGAVQARSLAWTAEALEAAQAWSEAERARVTARRDTLVGIEARADVLREEAGRLGPPSPGKGADELFSEVRALTDRLRGVVRTGPTPVEAALGGLERLDPRRREQLERWSAEAAALPDPERRAEAAAAIAAARDAMSNEASVDTLAAQVTEDAFRDALADLRRTKEVRHALMELVSAGALQDDRKNLLRDMVAETRLLVPQIGALLRERQAALLSAWRTVRQAEDFNGLLAVFRGLLMAGVLVLAWAMARPRALGWGKAAADRADGWRRSPWTTGQRLGVAVVIARTLRPAMDVALVVALSGWAWRLAPELGITLGVWGRRRVVGLVEGLTRFVAAGPTAQHPAVVTLSETSEALRVRSAWWLGLWWVTQWGLERLLADVVFADTLASVLGLLLDVLGVVLVAWLLVAWEPRIAGRVARLSGLRPWVAGWVERPSGTPLAPLRAAVLGAYLAAAAGWDVLQGGAAARSETAALTSVMDRVRLGTMARGEEPVGAALPPELDAGVVRALEGARPARKAAVDELSGHLGEWWAERRRGTVVVTSDRGDGVEPFLDSMMGRFRAEGRQVQVLRPDHRLVRRAELIGWLAASLQLEPTEDDVDALVEQWLAAPPSVVVLHDAELLFNKTVGGLEALRALLYVSNAASASHMVVLSVHRPAWAYLQRLGALAGVSVVRGVVDLAPMSGAELHKLILGTMESAGLAPSFRQLEHGGPFGALPHVERERAEQGYFRLLAEASGGCPALAHQIWRASLRQAPDGGMDVVITDQIAGRSLDVSQPEAFVLAAMRTLDRSTLPDLVAALNMPLDDVRATVRALQQRGLLGQDDHGFHVALRHQRSVTRALRRRHVIQHAV